MTAALRSLLAAAAVWHAGRFLLVALRRLPTPFNLDWLEGACLLHVQRLLDGLPLYGPPTLDFIPLIYTPLHFQVGAVACRLLGTGLPALRLVSLLAALACGVLLFLLVRGLPRGTAVGGLAGAGFFFAAYRVTGAWLDTARVDSLFLALLLASLLALRSGRPWVRSGLAAALLFLAFFTKQTALIVGVPVAAWCLAARRGPERAVYAAVLAALVAGSTVALDAASGGWYRYYVFTLPPQHTMGPWLLPGFWLIDLLRHAPLAVALAAAVAWRDLRDLRGGPWREASRELVTLAALVVASWLLRRHQGGYDNVLLPAYAGLAVALGRAVDLAARPRGRALLAAVALVQLALLRYPLGAQVPGPAAHEAAAAFAARLAALPGDVLAPSHPLALARAGKRARASSMALWDVQRVAAPRPETVALERELAGLLRRRAFAAVILDRPDEYPAGTGALDSCYTLADSTWTPAALTPVTGWEVWPRYLYLPRSEKDGVP